MYEFCLILGAEAANIYLENVRHVANLSILSFSHAPLYLLTSRQQPS